MLRFPFFSVFHDADGDASTINAGGVTVPVVPSATAAPTVTEITLPSNPSIEETSAVKALDTPATKPARAVRGPQDFGMESPEESSERSGLKERARGADGKFLPKAAAQAKAGAPVATSSPSTKAAAPAKPLPKAVIPVPAEPAAPAKIKIGDQEKTAEEWATHFKDLETKAATPKPAEATIPKVPETTPPAKTEAEIAAEQQQRETDFITRASEGYAMTDAELDGMLQGGAEGVKATQKFAARIEMKSRQFAAAKVKEMADHYDALLAPLLDRDTVLQTHLQDAAFLGAHADIKSHPQGLATYQKIKNDMRAGYDAIKAKVDAGTATRGEQAWSMLYEDMKPEQLQNDIAIHTRNELAKLPSPNAAPATPAKPVIPAKPVVTERPLSADRPGAAAAPNTGETQERRLAREVNASKGIVV